MRPDPLSGEFDAADPLHGDRGYAELARRHSASVHQHANTRRLAIYNKVARVTFRHDGDRLVARSEMMSVDHYHETAAPAAAFTVHELFFDEPLATPMPTIGP